MEAAWIGGGEAWKAKAAALRLRLRDRFRVAVDRHWPRAGVSDAYDSPTVQRWVSRFRRFRDGSSGRSAVFYQKRGDCYFSVIPFVISRVISRKLVCKHFLLVLERSVLSMVMLNYKPN